MTSAASPRRLVVDLAATAKNWSLPSWGADAIRAAAPDGWEVTIVRAATTSDGDGGGGVSPEVLDVARDAEVYFGYGLSPQLFAAAARLRWVHSAAAGVASLLFPGMRQSAVLLTNSGGVMGDTIAEHVVGGVIYLLRAFDVAVRLQDVRKWDKEPFVSLPGAVRELNECRALIVGTGGIGGGVGWRLNALGVRCVGVRRRADRGTPRGFERVIGLDGLDAELPHADILVLTTPLTSETGMLLTGARMDCLPPSAIVVNVARGALLDETALIERLRRGSLRGAVLDVFREEPLPPDSPLWGLRQVLITPHVAAVSPRRFWERELELFLDNWVRYRRGDPLRNLVDKDAGY
ncbi:MAG TPA: D-2-hydroxyacid dehydrogenase [Gemmatimonadaceae bacterium]|nr:D-2-hydroxyacid dehydrogenase [Gemmatimonadaceae bacterium]